MWSRISRCERARRNLYTRRAAALPSSLGITVRVFSPPDGQAIWGLDWPRVAKAVSMRSKLIVPRLMWRPPGLAHLQEVEGWERESLE